MLLDPQEDPLISDKCVIIYITPSNETLSAFKKATTSWVETAFYNTEVI